MKLEPCEKLDATEERMLSDLRRAHLRTPGCVQPRILKLLKKQFLSPSHLADLRIEHRALGLAHLPPPSPATPSSNPVRPEVK